MDPLRRFIHFETDPGDGGGESGGGEPAPPPDSGNGGEAAATFDPSVIEPLSVLAQHAPALSQLAEQFSEWQQEPGPDYGQQPDPYGQQGQQGYPQQFDLQIPDPTLDPAGFAQYQQQLISDAIQQYDQQNQPLKDYYAQQYAQQQIDEGFQKLPEDARLERYLPEDFPADQVNQALQAQASAYFDGDVPGALTQAASSLKGLLQAAADKGVADYKASIAGGGNEVREPGISGSGIEAVDNTLSYDEIINRAGSGAL